MEIRAAILAAADHIERNPRQFNYMEPSVPECGTRGCILGWVAHFAGAKPGTDAWDAVAAKMGLSCAGSEHLVWLAFDRIVDAEMGYDKCKYQTNPRDAAAFLRHWADKYHPAPQPTSDTKSERHTTPQVTTTPKAFDFEALAARLAREPRAEEIAHAL